MEQDRLNEREKMKPSKRLHDLDFQNSVLRCCALVLSIIDESHNHSFSKHVEPVMDNLRILSMECQQMIEEEKAETDAPESRWFEEDIPVEAA